MQKIIMHIDADAFFASVEQGFNPLLRARPLVVGGKEAQRGVVHTASYEARACGIRTGMPLFKAKALCPQAVFLKGDYEHYRAVSQIFQQVCLKYTPLVEFTSLDDAYLDISGSIRLFSSPQRVARAIVQEVRERTGVSLSVGIGSSKVIARIASGLNKPAGLLYVAAGREKPFLAQLPVDVLPGVGRLAKERLMDLRIFKVGQLAALPPLTVEQLFGKAGKQLWQYANGIDTRKVKTRLIPRQISRETSFEEDTADVSAVLSILQYLTERIGKTLREQDLLCASVAVKIGYADFKRHTAKRSLSFATQDSAQLFAAARRLFDEIRLRRTRIRQVGLAVSHIILLKQQGFLFDAPSRRQALNAAVDELRKRFGFMILLPADTLQLKSRYRMDAHGYILHNPALTR